MKSEFDFLMITVAVSDILGFTKMIPRVKYAVTLELKKVISTTIFFAIVLLV